MSTRRIGLLDHMGGGNLGDDTTQTAVIDSIRRRWPRAELFGFSMNPPDTEARHHIPSYPIRRKTWDHPDRAPPADVEAGAAAARYLPGVLARPVRLALQKSQVLMAEAAFLARSLAVLRQLDMFVISGGGQLLDSWGGPWAYPYTILKWTALARLTGTRCCFVNVGAGPIHARLSRMFIRRALANAKYVSFRDPDSLRLAREIGFNGQAETAVDCVYALDTATLPPPHEPAPGQRVLGLSPMAWCDPRRYWQQDQAAYQGFLDKLVAFGAGLGPGIQLKLFSTDIWFDAQTLQAVDGALQHATQTQASYRIGGEAVVSLQTLLDPMASMDEVVTCRFHGVVFAHLLNIPVIALAHHPKVTTLMRELGLSEYCLPIDSFTVNQLTEAYHRLVDCRSEIKARMAERAAYYRARLAQQFDALFPPEAAR